jgi:hypothetical protein
MHERRFHENERAPFHKSAAPASPVLPHRSRCRGHKQALGKGRAQSSRPIAPEGRYIKSGLADFMGRYMKYASADFILKPAALECTEGIETEGREANSYFI